MHVSGLLVILAREKDVYVSKETFPRETCESFVPNWFPSTLLVSDGPELSLVEEMMT